MQVQWLLPHGMWAPMLPARTWDPLPYSGIQKTKWPRDGSSTPERAFVALFLDWRS